MSSRFRVLTVRAPSFKSGVAQFRFEVLGFEVLGGSPPVCVEQGL